VDGDGVAVTKARGAQDEACLNLLRRWLSGDAQPTESGRKHGGM